MNGIEDKFTANLEYNITLDDYIEANYAYKKTSKLSNYGYLIFGILGVLFGLIGLTGIILTNFHYIYSYCVFFLGLFLIMETTLLYRIKLKKIWKREPSIRKPLFVTISEDKLIFKSPNSQTINSWEVYTKFIETKNLFLIFQQRNTFSVIPKRAFENTNVANNFRNLLKKKLLPQSGTNK